jgi:hypothetical protein
MSEAALGSFSLLWSKILRSSLWIEESKETKILWITMLALKDKNGQIIMGIVGLKDASKLTLDEVKASLAVLLAPDPNDHSGVENGRRLREIPGGWEIVNHDLYRFSTAEKREFWKQQKAEYRAKNESEAEVPKRKRRKKYGALPGEKAFVNALDDDDEAHADRITDNSL